MLMSLALPLPIPACYEHTVFATEIGTAVTSQIWWTEPRADLASSVLMCTCPKTLLLYSITLESSVHIPIHRCISRSGWSGFNRTIFVQHAFVRAEAVGTCIWAYSAGWLGLA